MMFFFHLSIDLYVTRRGAVRQYTNPACRQACTPNRLEVLLIPLRTFQVQALQGPHLEKRPTLKCGQELDRPLGK